MTLHVLYIGPCCVLFWPFIALYGCHKIRSQCPVGEHSMDIKLMKSDFNSVGWEGSSAYFIMKIDGDGAIVKSGAFKGTGTTQIVSHCLVTDMEYVITVTSVDDTSKLQDTIDVGVEVCGQFFVGFREFLQFAHTTTGCNVKQQKLASRRSDGFKNMFLPHLGGGSMPYGSAGSAASMYYSRALYSETTKTSVMASPTLSPTGKFKTSALIILI